MLLFLRGSEIFEKCVCVSYLCSGGRFVLRGLMRSSSSLLSACLPASGLVSSRGFEDVSDSLVKWCFE